MFRIYRVVLGFASLAACGLQRDYEAFLKAAANDSDVASSTGAPGSGGSESGSTGGAASRDPGDSGTGASSETSGGVGADASSSRGTTGPEETTGTTGSDAVCGNGVQEQGEECDDGNDEDTDACDNDCAAAWTIFITAYEEGGLGYTGKMNGLEGADTRCRKHALDGGLPRHLTFKALLSDSTTDAADRLHHARGYYRLVNGLPVAHGWDALVNEPLENPVNVSELGTAGPFGAWTGTQSGGTRVPGAEHCGDWKVENDFTGHWGQSGVVDAGWLMEPNPDVNPTICYDSLSLYCVEQP